MEVIVASAFTFLATAFSSWLLHRREKSKERAATEVAVEAMTLQLNTAMQGHVTFIEGRMQSEREWYESKLDRERKECDDKISDLAGRLAAATLQRRTGDS